MKRLAVILTAMIMIGTSMASMPASGSVPSGNPTITESQVKTAIKKGPVLVRSTRIPKPKIFRSNPHRATHFVLVDDNDDIFIYDDDLATSYRRKDLQKIENATTDDPDELSEDIRWRLFLARQLALLKYREIHG